VFGVTEMDRGRGMETKSGVAVARGCTYVGDPPRITFIS
jgi:hypothetical protein